MAEVQGPQIDSQSTQEIGVDSAVYLKMAAAALDQARAQDVGEATPTLQLERVILQDPYTGIKEMLPSVAVEYAHITVAYPEDSTVETDVMSSDAAPIIFSFTGVWGKGPECEGEIIDWAVAQATSKQDLEMYLLTPPGHGLSTDTPEKWRSAAALDQAAQVYAAFVRETMKKNPGRKVVINGWSMGSLLALKVAAELASVEAKPGKADVPIEVDQVVVYDPPADSQNFARLFTTFFAEPALIAKKAVAESTPGIKTLSETRIILKRIWHGFTANSGMKLGTVAKASKAVAQHTLVAGGDNTIERLNKSRSSTLPLLVLSGGLGKIVPQEQIDDLTLLLDEQPNLDVTAKKIENAGHQGPATNALSVGAEIHSFMTGKA
ncbi:alpha/beta fold hydrolase [Candidatus Woesebacteria bacterium]|nr:alpha/beta fold hydrolase [Candidatus Woesebacteria bacterium]